MLYRYINRTNEEEIRQVIEIVNIAFMEDAFFKLPEKQQRLKTSSSDKFGVEDIYVLLNKSQFIVCEDDGLILGCIRVEKVTEEVASFGMLSVPIKYANRGIGKRLVGEAEKWCLLHNHKRVEITVVNIRTPVVQFYQKLGYESFGEEIGFDQLLGGKFLSKEYENIVKFIWMGKNL